MKIVILDAKTLGEDTSLAPIESLGECVVFPNASDEDIPALLEDADVCVTNKKVLNEQTLYAAKKLSLICLCATGYNNVDIEYCKSRGIRVRNVRGYSSESVAQHTFALALSLMESISYYDNFCKSGAYTESGLANHIGRPYVEISNKRWGIIGMGQIGRKVAAIAEAMGAEVSYASVSGAERKENYAQVTMETLLSQSDIISLHSPLTEHTQGIIDGAAIAKMKRTAVLINVARGAIVDSHALASAIDDGRIYGAGIDVYEREPMEKDHPFLTMKKKDRIVLTPHIAWASKEARARCVIKVAENIEAYFAGKEINDLW
ncbi:MAG: D-2-hydroxyacid dehydrogenase [Clostridia bacterium]|nr:D-2-hydroxyacid dehydrogenase [Clostridia bacterium]